MTYQEWNTIIGEYFFRPENGGKDVLLYFSKKDLIKCAFASKHFETDDEAWNDFIKAILFGDRLPSENKIPYSPIDRPCELFKQWNKTDLPPFIAYLVLFIIPLTETYNGDFRTNNYYGKVTEFFRRDSIISHSEKIWISNFKEISPLWNALEYWSIITKNCELGVFELKKFHNPKWIHVGKPFSQCLFPPSAIRKLPQLFSEGGLIPNSRYSKEELKRVVLKLGRKLLQINETLLDLIRKSEKDELGQSILDIVHREYINWSGETDDFHDNQIKRNYTVVPLFLQLRPSEIDESVSFSFRAYYSKDFPEDLRFEGNENIYERNGWTRTLKFPFNENFEKRDEYNKWVARFPKRDLRIFVNASIHQLNSDEWIETSKLSRTEEMFLFCKKVHQGSIEEWGRRQIRGQFVRKDFNGIPEGWLLYKFSSPIASNPDFDLLTLYSKKRIVLVGGLKVNFRTFYNQCIPEVKVENSTGEEKVFLEFKQRYNERIYLQQTEDGRCWLIPNDTLLDEEFYIKIEDEVLEGNELSYCLTSPNSSATNIDETLLPSRDNLGNRVGKPVLQVCRGSNVCPAPKNSQRAYSTYTQYFTPLKVDPAFPGNEVVYNEHFGNQLCHYLTLKGVSTTEEFYEAFEILFTRKYPHSSIRSFENMSILKRTSLALYDHLGVLDYDYDSKRVVVNPPQMIFTPTLSGRKTILIGGRDLHLLDQLIKSASRRELRIEFRKQFEVNERYLLPDVLEISSYGTARNSYGEKNLLDLSNELGIQFSNTWFPQVALQEFASSIVDYERSLSVIEEPDHGWIKRIFNPKTLTFERQVGDINRVISLIEYKLNEYTYYYILWKDNRCYRVDRSWGSYLVLKTLNMNIILSDSKNNRAAIPLLVPLPRLLSESIMLLSGLAPNIVSIGQRKYGVFENIPSTFTDNLFDKLGQQPIKISLP